MFRKNHLFIIIALFIITLCLISCKQKEDNSNINEPLLDLDSSYESEEYDFLFQYPSQWTIEEEPWGPATKTSEGDPEKLVNIKINKEEEIVIFDSHSHNGGLFRLISGEEEEIVNVLGITGVMIIETTEAEGEEPQMRILVYYEDGYEEGIGMGGSYGACAKVNKETYEQHKELFENLFKSIQMKQL